MQGLYDDLVKSGVLLKGGTVTTQLPLVESAYEYAVSNLRNSPYV